MYHVLEKKCGEATLTPLFERYNLKLYYCFTFIQESQCIIICTSNFPVLHTCGHQFVDSRFKTHIHRQSSSTKVTKCPRSVDILCGCDSQSERRIC